MTVLSWLLAVLAVLGVLLLGAGAVTAGRFEEVDRSGGASLAAYLDGWSAGHGGYDPRLSAHITSALTVRWLHLVHGCARPLARRGVVPDVLTLVGGWTAALVLPAAAAGGRWRLAAAVAVALSGLVDSLDGAVAVLTGRERPFGSVLDSLIDRCADGLYLAGLYLLGADGRLCVAAGAALIALEYTRARAGAVGFTEVGVITPGERPTRIILAAAALVGAGVFPHHAALWGELGAAATLGVCLPSAVVLLTTVRRRL